MFVADGYIRVFQDVRGKYGSEGDYVMTRPLRGPLNPTEADHSTDAYDTIDWLVKNVPESNGRVGMIGSSYEGFTVVMALVDPHPALKVAAPDESHGGRLDGRRLVPLRRVPPAELRLLHRTDDRRAAPARPSRAGLRRLRELPARRFGGRLRARRRPRSAALVAQAHRAPGLRRFWQAQALDKLMAAQPLTVPTMWIQGLWDQEDMWGAIHCYLAVEPKDTATTATIW